MNPDRTPDRAPDGPPANGAPDGAPVPFGQHLIVDLAGCDPHLVADGDALTRLVLGLCEVIGMQPFGPPWAQRFALHDPVAAGWTIVQPITTSLVSLHACEARASVCLDVFSCRTFNAELAVDYATKTLGGYVTQQIGLTRGTTRPAGNPQPGRTQQEGQSGSGVTPTGPRMRPAPIGAASALLGVP